MAVMDLDHAEREDCLLPSTPPEALDMRGVASTGASIIVYLQILAIGPLGIGALAVASMASEPWEYFPLITKSSAAYAQGVPVPDTLLLQAAAPSVSPPAPAARKVSLGGKALPALEVTDLESEVALSQSEIVLPQVNLDEPPIPNADSAVPRPPILLEVD